jgi:hypothetical protein
VAVGVIHDYGVKAPVVHGHVTDQDTAKQLIEQTLQGLDAERIDILGMHRLASRYIISGPRDSLYTF